MFNKNKILFNTCTSKSKLKILLYRKKGFSFDVRVDKQFNFVLLKVQIKFDVKNDLC